MNTPTSSPDLSIEQKIEAYMRCADAAWKSLADRRVYEWKLSFGLWAALGAFAGFVEGQRRLSMASYDSEPAIIVCILLVISGGIYTFWWVPAVRERDAEDHATMAYFLDKVEDGLNACSRRKTISQKFAKDRKEKRSLQIYNHWASGSQVVITWMLVTVALVSILPRPYSNCTWAGIVGGLAAVLVICVLIQWRKKLEPDPDPPDTQRPALFPASIEAQK